MSEQLILPDYASLSDDELMKWSNKEFVDKILEKAAAFGTDVMNRDHYEIEKFDEEERKQRLILWNQKHAWLEWWLGVAPPSKQLVMLGEEDMPIKILLAQQIVDEVKHQRVFTKRVVRLGGDAKLDRFQPDPVTRRMYDTTFFFDDPLDIAASLQCTGEAVLMHHVRPELSITYATLDEDTLEDMANDVAPDEPRHVKNGEDLYKKYANTPERRRRIAQVQDLKLHTLIDHYIVDHELVGAKRIKPMPLVPPSPVQITA